MTRVISKEKLRSVWEVINPAEQITRIKLAVFSLPAVANNASEVLQAAPYLVFIYILYGSIDFLIQLNPAAEVTGLTTLFTLIIAAGAITLTYIETHNTLSNRPPIQTPWKYTLLRLPQLIGTAIAVTIVVLLGLTVFVIPGIYLSFRLITSLPATVLEDGGIRHGIQDSFTATDGQFTLIVVFGGVLSVIATVIVIGLVSTRGVTQLGFAFLLSGPIQLVTHILLAMLYLNGRGEEIIPQSDAFTSQP